MGTVYASVCRHKLCHARAYGRIVNSDQNKEDTVTRTERDGKEPNTLLNILRERNLFNNDEPRLRNVETGAIGDKNVNVDK